MAMIPGSLRSRLLDDRKYRHALLAPHTTVDCTVRIRVPLPCGVQVEL